MAREQASPVIVFTLAASPSPKLDMSTLPDPKVLAD
jgi:hypothetical protein